MLAILVLAGSGGLSYSLPIAATIAFLMLAVGVSYRQTIRAYPHGGGSYIVASDNLGRMPGLIAAAGLMTDYILTVAVSVASGLEAITSAIPSLTPDTGADRSWRDRRAARGQPARRAPGRRAVRRADVRCSSSRCSRSLRSADRRRRPRVSRHAEAAADRDRGGRRAAGPARVRLRVDGDDRDRGDLQRGAGLQAGRVAQRAHDADVDGQPADRLFAGTIAIVQLDGVVPNAHETVLSQLAHRSFGSGFMYPVTQAATAAILLLAANTAYNDFPRVLFLLARDFQAPRLFLRIGDRLAFSNGIIALSAAAAAIFVAFGGNTAPLIPLYAVGVFLAFTLSQAGMVVHWWRRRAILTGAEPAFNATGACSRRSCSSPPGSRSSPRAHGSPCSQSGC
jgi:4-hydroxybenzoate polyprenyltransferase